MAQIWVKVQCAHLKKIMKTDIIANACVIKIRKKNIPQLGMD